MTPEQALQFITFLIDNKTMATKQEFVQAQQAIEAIQQGLKKDE
jgi:hypothetical protein